MPLTRLGPSARNLLFGLLTAVLLFAYVGLFRNALIDDAFITLNYVKTLTTSGTWGYFPGHVTNTATSPLNVLVLSVITLVTRSPSESVFWLTLIEWLVLLYFLRGIARCLGLPWFAPLAFVALVANPLLDSTIGLESILFATLIVATLYFFVSERYLVLAVTAALLTLTRPDGILLFLVAFVFLPGWRTRLHAIIGYGVVLAPWYLYSWLALGSLIPDTFLIKVRQSWGSLSFSDGLRLYFRRYPSEVILSFFWIPLAFLALFRPVRQIGAVVWILLAYGMLHFAAYSILHVPPYHWYYVPEVVCLVLLGALAVSKLVMVGQLPWQRLLTRTLLLLAFLVPLGGTGYLVVRDGIFLRESFIATNWATHEQYRTIGLYLKEQYSGKTVPINGEPGTIAYYCECYALDYTFNVRDWLARDVAAARKGTQPLDWVARVNYHFFKPPTPYPPPTANLQVFTVATQPPDPNQPHWFTSTRWVKAGLVILHEPE